MLSQGSSEQRVFQKQEQSYWHLAIVHGSGAISVKSRRSSVEPLDLELLEDLSGPGKPPVFDGNDAEYQDFRFSFRIHMSLVSSVSQTLMDKCEAERFPISLATVKARREASLTCCTQMYFSLDLKTKGSVRTLVRSVEEAVGRAEAWGLIQQIRARYTEP